MTGATVRAPNAIRSAVSRRMPLNSSRTPGACGASARAWDRSPAPVMSRSRMRPPRPLPTSRRQSTPSSAAARRARGLATTRRPAVLRSAAEVLSSLAGIASPAATRYASTVPTGTSTPSPGERGDSCRMPLSGASSSTVALSPAIVQIGSPASTCSPSFFSHSAMLPTFMSQPRRGMLISVGMRPLENRPIHHVRRDAAAQDGDHVLDGHAAALQAGLDRPARRVRRENHVVECSQWIVCR